LILGYFILSPFVGVFMALLNGEIEPTLYHVLIFGFFCVVVIFFIILALGVYNKDKDAKIETAKAVEFTPTEKFTLKQTANMLLGLINAKGDNVVPAPIEPCAEDLIKEMSLEELGDLLKKEVARRNIDG